MRTAPSLGHDATAVPCAYAVTHTFWPPAAHSLHHARKLAQLLYGYLGVRHRDWVFAETAYPGRCSGCDSDALRSSCETVYNLCVETGDAGEYGDCAAARGRA